MTSNTPPLFFVMKYNRNDYAGQSIRIDNKQDLLKEVNNFIDNYDFDFIRIQKVKQE